MATLTIRNLEEDVKQRLRLHAARNGRSMEAEARYILSLATHPETSSPAAGSVGVASAVAGRWKGRGNTEDTLKMTRGE